MRTFGAAAAENPDTGDEADREWELARKLAQARDHAEEIQILLLLDMMEKSKLKLTPPLPLK